MSKFSNFHTRDLHNEAFIVFSDDEDGLSFEEYENFRISLQVLMVLRLKKMRDNKEREKREKLLLKKNINSKQQNMQTERKIVAANESKVKDSSSSKILSTNLIGIPKFSNPSSFRLLSDINTETPKSNRTNCSTAEHSATRSLRPDKLSAETPVDASHEILNKSSIRRHKSETDLAKSQIPKLVKSQKSVEMKHSKTKPSLNDLSKFSPRNRIDRIHLKNKNIGWKNQFQGLETNNRLNGKLAFSTTDSNIGSSSCEDNTPEASNILRLDFNVASSEPPKKTLQEKNLSEFSISVPERKTKMPLRRKSIQRDANLEYAKKRLWKNEKATTDIKPISPTPNNSNSNSKSKLYSYEKSESACAPETARNLKTSMSTKHPETNKTFQNENSITLKILSLEKKADEYFRLRKILEDKAERYKDKTERMNELSEENENRKINTTLVFPTPRTKVESASCVNLSNTSNSSKPNSSTESSKMSNLTLQSKDMSNLNASYFYYGTKISFEEKRFLENPIFDKIATSRKPNYNDAENSKAVTVKRKSAEAASETLHSLLLSSLQISTPQPKTGSSRYHAFSRKSI